MMNFGKTLDLLGSYKIPNSPSDLLLFDNYDNAKELLENVKDHAL